MRKLLAAITVLLLASSGISPASADWKNDVLGLLSDKSESNSSSYQRSSFRHWVDADRDRCDTRSEVLIDESLSDPQISSPCKVNIGQWFSTYDERMVYVASLIDIDHMVPLKEAWESGASSWTAAKREAFANDLGFKNSLLAVSAASNRSKGDKDPSGWLPPAKGQICDYVAAWIGVKYRWDLSVDSREKAALSRGLQTCPPGSVINLPAKVGKPGTEKAIRFEGPQVELTPIPTPEPTLTPTPTQTATPTPTPSPTGGAVSLLRGRPWYVAIEGPKEFTRGEPFTLRLRLTDLWESPVENKTINYRSRYVSGITAVTDSQGYVELRISSLESWGDILFNFNSDFASGNWTLTPKAASTPSPTASPTPTPTQTPTPSPSDGTTSYRLITPGAFCARDEAGTQGRSSAGLTYTCKTSSTENRLRWRR